MKQKRILAGVVACILIATTLVACSGNLSGQIESVVAVTEIVTDADGEAVTDENGNVVTEVVTDENGNVVTEIINGTTAASTSTTATTTAAANNESSGGSASGGSSSGGSSSGGSSSSSGSSSSAGEPVEEEISIVLGQNRTASCSSSNVSIATGKVTITKPGDYVITSTTAMWYGQIVIMLPNTEKANVKFENVNITNDTCNIIQIIDTSIESDRTFIEAEASIDTAADDQIQEISESESAPNVSLSFPDGTSSSFKTTANGRTGIIYNESKLTIKGNGACSITCDTRKANNCICSTKSVTIKNVNINLTTAMYNSTDSLGKTDGSAKGIFSYGKVNVESGTININSNGDCIRCDSLTVDGGTLNLKSSACDGVDADDAIVINAGSIKSVALQKTSFKVRRVNNTENGYAKGVRSGKGDGFFINGGVVVGESKKISSLASSYQSDGKSSTQPCITCKAIKSASGGTSKSNDSKTPGVFTIGTLNKTSTYSCTKYLYSSSKISKGTAYSVSVKGGNNATVSWSGNIGEARVVSSNGR